MMDGRTFFAVARAHDELIKKLLKAVRYQQLKEVSAILEEVAKGAEGEYRVRRTKRLKGQRWFVAVTTVGQVVNDRSTGTTLLCEASSQEMRKLLESYGADPDRTDVNGMPPAVVYHHAAADYAAVGRIPRVRGAWAVD